MSAELFELARTVGQVCKTRNWRLVTAESCTGGGIAQTMTEVPGSSLWFDRGFVTYSNAAKIQMLGVNAETIESSGAVSAETVSEMARGALLNSEADWSIAVTGIAGPDGGTLAKPVGTVYLAWQCRGENAVIVLEHFSGSRQDIRAATIERALSGWLHMTG